ncbi:FAD/NAD(P)-binding domain-containing protein [Dipodascopsis uninucleata]
MARGRILICGSGVSGLCLAQGLKKAGIPFQVFERDSNIDTRAQGYRLRLDSRGARALRSNLSEDHWRLFKESCALTVLGFKKFDAITGQEVEAPRPGGPQSEGLDPENDGPFTVDRGQLRRVLMKGIEDSVTFGKQATKYETNPGASSEVSLIFSDGSSENGSLIVAADGARSLIRKQFLPDMRIIDTTGRYVYGKTPLTDEFIKRFIPDGLKCMTFIKDEVNKPLVGGYNPILLLEAIRFQKPSNEVLAAGLPKIDDYAYWVFIGTRATFKVESDSEFNRDPVGISLRASADWDATARAILELQDRNQTSALHTYSALPEIQPWEPSEYVTLIGDAIHPISPSGANVALQDTHALVEKLSQAYSSTGLSVKDAIASYEADMRVYASKAVSDTIPFKNGMYSNIPYEQCESI